ncbi:hypothetical protein GCM10022224_026480 [Nonomuraea antimicrobica]|uniref:Uncharacterized protein n=1 Tax=Nonomuraea antimicrobica TaxID=561173 RepID=A0ABP7BIF5_9ACTN
MICARSDAAAGAALTGLLAGIPAILLIFFWPIDLPTIDDLATPGEPIVIQTLLLATVWTCWALFALAVTVELVGTIRARRSHVRLPFQRLAAYLITTITVAANRPHRRTPRPPQRHPIAPQPQSQARPRPQTRTSPTSSNPETPCGPSPSTNSATRCATRTSSP